MTGPLPAIPDVLLLKGCRTVCKPDERAQVRRLLEDQGGGMRHLKSAPG
jgi:hypothetical protein